MRMRPVRHCVRAALTAAARADHACERGRCIALCTPNVWHACLTFVRWVYSELLRDTFGSSNAVNSAGFKNAVIDFTTGGIESLLARMLFSITGERDERHVGKQSAPGGTRGESVDYSLVTCSTRRAKSCAVKFTA